MAYVPEEMMHERQIKVRLVDSEYDEWKEMAHKEGQLHSVMARIAMRAILEEYRRTGQLPDFIAKQRA
jgi:hypothetical protein